MPALDECCKIGLGVFLLLLALLLVEQLVVDSELLGVLFRLGGLGPGSLDAGVLGLLVLVGISLERLDVPVGNGLVDDGPEALVVLEDVAQHDHLVDLVHAALELLVGGEDVVLFLVRALVLGGELLDGVLGDGVAELLGVELGPGEVGAAEGLGGVACGVVALPPCRVRQDCVGECDLLEFLLGFLLLCIRAGDLVCGCIGLAVS